MLICSALAPMIRAFSKRVWGLSALTIGRATDDPQIRAMTVNRPQGGRVPDSITLYHHGNGVTATEAYRHDSTVYLGALHSVDQGHQAARSGGSERMP